MGTLMKTTIEVSDALLEEAKRYAKARGITLRTMVEEGLRAAAAIGDDRLQKMQTGYVQPEAFTHGTSEQRQQWLRRGMEGGDPDACNTFQTAGP